MIKAVYPGTFDPLTRGHEDLVRRAATLFDHVVLAIAQSTPKRTFFMLEERIAIAKEVLGDMKNVEVMGFSGLLTDFVRKQRANVAAALASQTLAALEDQVIERLGLPVVRGRRTVAGALAEAALLVGRDSVDALKAALADLEAEQAWCGLRFAIVGPWPPYSFVPALDGN